MSHLDDLLAYSASRVPATDFPRNLVADARDELSHLRMTLDAKERSVVDLREHLKDWQDAAIEAEREPCPNERHCTCVGLLRHEIAELRAKVAELEKRP